MYRMWFRKLFSGSPGNQEESSQTTADQGDAESQYSLASTFADVQGTEPDYTQAVHWYELAADQGHAQAQFSLGMMFTDGGGMPRDNAKATRWFCKAAQQGHAGAQHNLGLKHRRASFTGLPADALESNLEAYKWFRLAAAQGNKPSDAELECIALTLTREQVGEGDRRADKFIVEQPHSVQVPE